MMLMDENSRENKITFIHFGRDKCPHCGSIGNEIKEKEFQILECPLCSTKFTNEIVLHKGNFDSETIFDNN